MKNKHDLSNHAIDLYYGLALIAFGEEAVNIVLNHAKWLEKYPDLIKRLNSTDSTKYGILLSGEIIYEIAGRNECRDDFYADLDNERLYAVERDRKWAEPSVAEARGYKKIPTQEALLTYGAYCLFKAADSSYGRRGEKQK